jgi:hypothetical protein
MTAEEILTRLKSDGIEVTRVGENLKVTASQGRLTEAQKALITTNKVALLEHFAPNKEVEEPAKTDGSCEGPFKEYIYPGGKVLKLTKEEFETVVDVFRMLLMQDMRSRKPEQSQS